MDVTRSILRLLLIVIVCHVVGCASSSHRSGLVSPHTIASSAGIGGPVPMTLPHFLGIDTASNKVCGMIHRGRLFLSPMIPILEPGPPVAMPLAMGDPANLQSPSPAVAAAASIQQAEAAAPGKIKALRYLSTMDCSRNPQVEEAFLAGLDDCSDSVRIAAVESIIDSNKRCQSCSTTCKSCSTCGGCCTPAIFARLNHLAYSVDEKNCWSEPNSKVRRLARIALSHCNSPEMPAQQPMPLEMPSPATIELLHAPPAVR